MRRCVGPVVEQPREAHVAQLEGFQLPATGQTMGPVDELLRGRRERVLAEASDLDA